MTVLAADGTVRTQGIAAFREGYATMFERHRDVHAEVDARVILGPHLVEREAWSRVARDTGTRSAGTVLVRYSEADGLIRFAQFFPER